MKTIIHIKQQNLRANRKDGGRRPVAIVRTYKTVQYGSEVLFENVSGRLVYRPDKPLPCGATVWLEFHDGKIEVLNSAPATVGKAARRAACAVR